MEEAEDLLRRAREVRERAHAPYSGLRVGAALMAGDGTVHVGCNVENASYGVTLCAERVALGAAIAAGRRSFRALALSTSAGRAVPPCGACRQALAEFAADLHIVSEGPGGRGSWSLPDLFPDPFREVSRGRRAAEGPESGLRAATGEEARGRTRAAEDEGAGTAQGVGRSPES